MKKEILTLAGLLFLAACGERSELNGPWVQPIPGMEGKVQGMMLLGEGQAASINMNTLKYKNWRRQGDKLILSGESIGNGQTIAFEEEYLIEKLTPEQLVLRQGAQVEEFSRPE